MGFPGGSVAKNLPANEGDVGSNHGSESGNRLQYSLFFFFPSLFNWRIITLQYNDGFSHTSIWIGQRYTYVPSILNPFPTSLPTLSLSLSTTFGCCQWGSQSLSLQYYPAYPDQCKVHSNTDFDMIKLQNLQALIFPHYHLTLGVVKTLFLVLLTLRV